MKQCFRCLYLQSSVLYLDVFTAVAGDGWLGAGAGADCVRSRRRCCCCWCWILSRRAAANEAFCWGVEAILVSCRRMRVAAAEPPTASGWWWWCAVTWLTSGPVRLF